MNGPPTTDFELPPVFTEPDGTKHALRFACYRKHGPVTPADAPKYVVLPTLECVCGMWWSGETWEDAGSYFDDHLTDVSDGPA